jgi:hypothetical protein
MNEKISRNGRFIIKHKDGTDIIENKITDSALEALAQALITSPTTTQIKYLALGNNSAAVTGAETKLGSEFFRTALTDISRTGNVVTTTFYVLSGEGLGQIEEIGIFCGSTATETKDSGLLLSRILWSREKTFDEELTVTREDTIGRND